MPDDCIFCNIVTKTIGADVIYQDDQLMVIRDILPKAPVHLLVIPKAHIPSLNELGPVDGEIIGKMVMAARDQARKHEIAQSGYKLIFNVGVDGGQTVNHLHLHLLGGKRLGE